MNLQSLLSELTRSTTATNTGNHAVSDKLGQLGNFIPGGFAGGAIAGSVMALLLGNKSARKFAGTAAGYGVAAVLGGLAYKAYKNWQHGKHDQTPISENRFTSAEIMSAEFQLLLIKSMIAAARADNHINANQQQQIFEAINKMELSTDMKARVFDLLSQPITVDEIAQGATTMEQRSELYLISCLVADPQQPAEKAHLANLARALELPPGLTQQLQLQAQQTMAAA